MRRLALATAALLAATPLAAQTNISIRGADQLAFSRLVLNLSANRVWTLNASGRSVEVRFPDQFFDFNAEMFHGKE